MSLLSEIQNAAIDSDVDISVVLRKCKVLASKLRNQEFELWVEHELNGYTTKEELPEYRIFHRVESLGNFYGAYGKSLKNAPIPLSCLPEEYREPVSTLHLVEPVSYYSSLLKSKGGKEDFFSAPWSADLIFLVGSNIYEDMNCLTAWRHIPASTFASLLDTIRNRILSFVLEIQAVAPDVEQTPPRSKEITEERISQVFQTYILGNVTNLAAGDQTIVRNIQITVIQNDLESLRKFLESLGIGQQDIEDLNNAISKDAQSSAKSGIGKNVGAWIGKMINKASSGAWNVATTVAANVLTRVLLRYYGLD